MSSRPLLSPYKVITAGDMSANITSEVTIIQRLSMISYGCVSTGSPVGTLSVQVSNTFSLNPDGSVNNAGDDWNELTNSAVSSAGTVLFNLTTVAAYAIRVKYTFTSGTGSLNVTVAGKVS